MDTYSKPYEWDRCMIEAAFTIAKMSKDPRTQVGAVLCSADRRRVSFGYNGFPSSIPDRQEWWNARHEPVNGFTKYDVVIHGEMNAILQARCDLTDWSLYCTHVSCPTCAKHVLQSGIKRVVYCLGPEVIGMQINMEQINKMFSIAGCELIAHPEWEPEQHRIARLARK